MHAPVILQTLQSVRDDLHTTVAKKLKPNPANSERVLRERRNTSKTESSGSSSDTPSNEECESCGTVGNLVTCDGCYGAYHIECFNPTSVEETEESHCFDCTTLMNRSKGMASPSSGQEVIEEMPKPKSKASGPSEKASSKKRKQPTKLCNICDQLGELVACMICEKAFHTYCVDLVHPTPHFKCSDHDDVELIPRERFPLHFTPEKWRDDIATLRMEDDKDSILSESNPSELDASDQDIPDLLILLGESKNFPEIVPAILKNFSPKFIEFLAWQQLREIQKAFLDRKNGKE